MFPLKTDEDLGSQTGDGVILDVADRVNILNGVKADDGRGLRGRLRLDPETFDGDERIAGTGVGVDDPPFVGVAEAAPDTSDAMRSRRVM